jgi:hypothetical protein
MAVHTCDAVFSHSGHVLADDKTTAVFRKKRLDAREKKRERKIGESGEYAAVFRPIQRLYREFR